MGGMKRQEWQAKAKCRQVPADQFFPGAGRPSNKLRGQCEGCPVREECLEFVLSSPWRPCGIWAGLTAKELAPLWDERHPDAATREIQDYVGLGPKW